MAHPLLNSFSGSSTVAAYRHIKVGDEIDSYTSLFVEFKTGKVYRYIVPHQVCINMDLAPSKGQFINQMKATHAGILLSEQSVTDMLLPLMTATTEKTRKSKQNIKKLYALCPELAYFF